MDPRDAVDGLVFAFALALPVCLVAILFLALQAPAYITILW